MKKLLKLLGIHIHDWEYINDYYTKHYLDEELQEPWPRWRRCKDCGCIMESYFCSAGQYWQYLTEGEIDVFNRKVLNKEKK